MDLHINPNLLPVAMTSFLIETMVLDVVVKEWRPETSRSGCNLIDFVASLMLCLYLALKTVLSNIDA